MTALDQKIYDTALPGTARLDGEQVQLLALLATGLPVEAIARRMHMSPRTVRRRCRAACNEIGVGSVIEAVVWAARRGVI